MLRKIIFILGMLHFYALSAEAQKTAIQPTFMVIPSDNLVQRLGYVQEVEVDGRTRYIPDYEQMLIKEPELRFSIAEIQDRFAERGFPLKDFEFFLKRRKVESAFKQVEDLQLSVKDQLLRDARPDFYLDLNYFYSGTGIQKSLTFELRAVDAYSVDVIAVASYSGNEGLGTNVAKLIAEQVERNMFELEGDISEYFAELRGNGRKVSLRISVEKGANITDFRRSKCGDIPVNRLIRAYVQRNTVKSAFIPGRSGISEIFYEQVRIPLFDDAGFPIDASDWAYELSEYLSDQCSCFAIDNTSRLGEAHVLFIKD